MGSCSPEWADFVGGRWCGLGRLLLRDDCLLTSLHKVDLGGFYTAGIVTY